MKKLIILLIIFFTKISISSDITDGLDLSEAPKIGQLGQLLSLSESSDEGLKCPFGSEDSFIKIDAPNSERDFDLDQSSQRDQKERQEQSEPKLCAESIVPGVLVLAEAQKISKKEDSQYNKVKKTKKREKKEKAEKGTYFKPEEWQQTPDGLKHKKCGSIIHFTARSKHAKICKGQKKRCTEQLYHDDQWTNLENGKTKHKICGREIAKTNRIQHEKFCDGVHWIAITQGNYRHLPCNQEVGNSAKKRHLEKCKISGTT